MKSLDRNELFHQLEIVLDNCHPSDWGDIVDLLKQIKNKKKALINPRSEDFMKSFARGTAFITFSYGIDGVSIEMSKYAHIINDLYTPLGTPSIHFICGHFHPEAVSILGAEWHRNQIDGIDGWDKWDDGTWFNALFLTNMKSFSAESSRLTSEIYKQAKLIANRLGKYFVDNKISFVIPVNVASNPGNIAFTLGLVLVTEIFGTYVLNSNHDFYWEAGLPASMREPGEQPGVRDHFFRNRDNKTFFLLFDSLFPWNGSRWLQANINAYQSRILINNFGFSKEKVFEISTSVADTFFELYSKKDVFDIRLRMGHILSNGEAIMRPVPVADHLSRVECWMKNQQPIILGAHAGLSVNPRSDDLIILLQPTRIISRKRIERNFELIRQLFQKSALQEEFRENLNCQLILHISGPTPIEHQEALQNILFAYQETINGLPELLANRIFLAFSAGHETHTSFSKNKFQPLTIEAIYRMADVVVFPSEAEGRGLPIIEASASGLPIICSHYRHKDVFSDVIGEKLDEELRIKYIVFPEGEFSQTVLSDIANLLIHPGTKQNNIIHNREAVRARYSYIALKHGFERLLNQLSKLN